MRCTWRRTRAGTHGWTSGYDATTTIRPRTGARSSSRSKTCGPLTRRSTLQRPLSCRSCIDVSPLLTLGLPGSATAAVLLTAFQQYGIQPGPLLFTTRPELVWTLIASLYIGNVLLLVLNLPLAPLWARVMLIPPIDTLWRHSGAGVGRRLQPQPIAARPCAALHRWRCWLGHARLRHPAGPGGDGPRSWPAHRASIST